MNIRIMMCGVFLLPVFFQQVCAFKQLGDLEAYAQAYPLYPKSDNDDWEDPDYSSFHIKNTPGRFKRFLRRINIFQKPLWSEQRFVQLLQSITDARETAGISGEIVAKITLDQPERLYVWGDVHGAFHALVQSLRYLYEEGIIDQDLRIIKEHCYFIFNGDFIDRSPYVLESLTVMLRLMEQNPDKVLYVRGRHEHKNYWHNYGLERELRIRLKHLSVDVTPFGELVSRFFNTLPLSIYINGIDQPETFIRISHTGRTGDAVREEFFTDLLLSDTRLGLHYLSAAKSKSSGQMFVPIIIKTEEWIKEHRVQRGLGHLGPDLDSTAWSILSSPIEVYQKFYDFYYAAFAIIDASLPIQDSRITLYNRDVRTQEPFKKRESYHLRSGLQITNNFIIPGEIPIGASLSLTAGIPFNGQGNLRGILARLDKQKEEGGINGKFVKLIVYDDRYEPSLSRQNAERFLNMYHINTMLLQSGAPTIGGYIDYIQAKKLLLLFPVTGTMQFRPPILPPLPDLIHLRPSYSDEVNTLIDYLIKTHLTHKFACFYQDDSLGRGAMVAAREALKRHGFKEGEWLELPIVRASFDFKAQAQKMRDFQPDAIGLFSTAQTAQVLFQNIGTEYLVNKELFAISFVGEDPFRIFLKTRGLHVHFGAVVPNPRTDQREMSKEYRAQMDKHNYPYGTFSFEGYIGTSILIDRLKRIKGPVTKEAIIKEFELLNNYELGGFTFTLDPYVRSLMHTVWIETGPDEEWLQFDIPIKPAPEQAAAQSAKKDAPAKDVATSSPSSPAEIATRTVSAEKVTPHVP